MKLKEAYSILEISETATPEEAKKKYRELTKKYHPDVNKEAGAEDKFKKINEAYQVVSSGKSTDREDQVPRWGGQRSWDPFSGFQQRDVIVPENIDVHTTISFKEAVLGCKKDIKFNRKTKCKDCNGNGEIVENNGCDKCGGRGQVVTRQGNMMMVQTCDKCYGRTKSKQCSACKGSSVQEAEVSIAVSIPGGVQTGNILRLAGIGNFAGHFLGSIEQHTDVHLYLTVTPEAGLRIDGNQVVSTLEISLLEALRGCKKSVKTVLGDKEVNIKPLSKNRDEVTIPRVGINGTGNQKVILDIMYPKDVTKLIDTLLSEKET